MRKLRLAEPEMVIGHRKLPADRSWNKILYRLETLL
jgi:hypothetical protein